MEKDEMEMTREEFQMWIRGKVKEDTQVLNTLEKCAFLKSLLDKKMKQSAHLQKLSESVAACEEIVKKQYSLLGWEYKEIDSYSNGDAEDGGNLTDSAAAAADIDDSDDTESQKRLKNNRTTHPCGGGDVGVVTDIDNTESRKSKSRDVDENLSDSLVESNPTPSKKTKQEDGSDSLIVYKRAVVVLTRLTQSKIDSLGPRKHQQVYPDDKSLINADSDVEWKPEGDSSDSDFSGPTNKRMTVKPSRIDTRPPEPAPQLKPPEPAPQVIKNNEAAPYIISSVFSYCAAEVTKARPNLPQEVVKVDMIVVARKKSMKWQRGKISAIAVKEEGRLKYKVCFEKKGRSLVSGHHIAFDTAPRMEHLYVGARLVISCEEDGSLFKPGILAELPTRRNCSRFLVFLDDHTPIYCGISSLRLVCRPLEDPIDNLSDGLHKSFMTRYLRNWPYPHLTQYSIGHILNAELGGEQQRCEVQQLDCSLIQVVFQDTQHQEWIHRGSTRLQHMSRFWEMKELETKKQKQKHKDLSKKKHTPSVKTD